MNRVGEVRLVRLVKLLRPDHRISARALMDELEVGRATLMADIRVLRDQLNMPIAYDREENGYFLAGQDVRSGPRYEIPGLWLSANQAQAILTLLNVCLSVAPTLLRPLALLRPLMKAIAGMPTDPMPEVEEKLAFEISQIKDEQRTTFIALSKALYAEKQVNLRGAHGAPAFRGRYSPQRFILTNNGWVLDAYNHKTKDRERLSFSEIEHVAVLDRAATIIE